MSKWNVVKLDTLADFKNGLNYSSENFGKGLKVIGVSDFQDYTFPKYELLDEINPKGVAREQDLLAEGDFVFVRSNGNRELIGRCLMILNLKEKISHSGFTIRVRFFAKNIDNRFYLYFFKSDVLKKTLRLYGGGTNINNLNQGILSNLNVPLPPLFIQHKIAAILSAYDEYIENNNRRIAILEKMADEIYREWFVCLRFPGHEKVKIVKGVPKGWKVKSLADICSSIKTNYIEQEHQSHPLVDLEKITSHTLSIRKVGEANELSTSRIIFQEDDVLFSSIRPYLNKVHLANFNGVTNTSVLVLRANKSIYRSFLTAKLFTENTINWAIQYSTGTKMPVIPWNTLKKMNFYFPNIALLKKFEDNVFPIYEKIKLIGLSNFKIKKSRDLLLPRLISGKLDVEKLDIAFPPGMKKEQEEANA